MTQETETPEEPKAAAPAAAAPAKAKASQKAGKGKRRGKRYRGLAEKIDRTKTYSPADAVKLVKETAQAKFDTSVDLHLRMGVDPRHAEQMVRGSAVLPNGTGKTVRVVVFAQGDKAREAQAAGADVVGADDLAKRIEGGWLDFDVAIATPDMMGAVGKLGKVLGPRGLMPNPKSGTVTFDLAKAVKDSKGGRIEFRVDKTGVVHTVVGKASFTEQALLQNLATLMDALNRARPTGLKANYIESVYLTSTQGPSVKLDLGEATALAGRATS
jgi:large subunit ribosomal protein L1